MAEKKNYPLVPYDPAVNEEYVKAVEQVSEHYGQVARGYFSTFDNIRPGISARPQFDRSVYEHFRPGEALPKNYKDVVALCDNMYHQLTLVRNIIDLMGDFACQGIRLVHPVKTVERFYNEWFKKINGFDRSERFLNYFYRHAMVVLEAQVGKISKRTRQEFTALAEDYEIKEREIILNEIPLNYIFHHPALVFPKNPMVINDQTEYQLIVKRKVGDEKYIDSLGYYGFDENRRDLPIDKTFVHYYKRDEWQVKPIPFLYPLIKHAIMLEKLNLADSAALDGAISAVRIFKLGNLDAKLAPTTTAVARLNEILQANVGGGSLDLIWGPDIELIESNTNVHQFLGEAKYTPHLHQMYIGLGIPPSLAGNGGTGTTNNYISLKVLTKRLQYGRKHLIDFWDKQIKWVQKAMGFARPAKIEFDFLDLGDEQAEKQLLIQLADRNLVSDEKLQTIFGYDSEMEKARLNREERERNSGRRVSKITSLPDSLEVALKKIALQQGVVTPKELGLELEETPDDDIPSFDKQLEADKEMAKEAAKVAMKKAAQTKKPGGAKVSSKGRKSRGRPSTSKDSKTRKKSNFKPKIKAALEIWATDSQKKITEIVKPKFLKLTKKKNLRQLTTTEALQFEHLLFGVLLKMEPFSDITKNNVANALDKQMPIELFAEYSNYIKQVAQEVGRELSLEEKHKIQGMMYAAIYEEQLNGDS